MIVSAIIIRKQKILTIKRKNNPLKGMYGLPGGHVEEGESEIGALEREVKEETGLIIKTKKAVGAETLHYKEKNSP